MYEKQTWVTGDVVTADRLNHMEDGITSAQAYTESEDVKFSGSVTMAEQNGVYIAQIDCDLSDEPEQIKVVFDGTEYACEKISVDPSFGYGGIGESGLNFSEYPFVITVYQGTYIYTETASAHQVEIVVTTKAVNEDLVDVINQNNKLIIVNYDSNTLSPDTSIADIKNAVKSGKSVIYREAVVDGATVTAYIQYADVNCSISEAGDIEFKGGSYKHDARTDSIVKK